MNDMRKLMETLQQIDESFFNNFGDSAKRAMTGKVSREEQMIRTVKLGVEDALVKLDMIANHGDEISTIVSANLAKAATNDLQALLKTLREF